MYKFYVDPGEPAFAQRISTERGKLHSWRITKDYYYHSVWEIVTPFTRSDD